MPDAIRQEEDEAPRGLGEIFFEGVVGCFPESLALVPVALLIGSGILFLCLIGSGLYHLAFDPDAANVNARLDALSIDPGKWMGLS